jgi:hypothetical protein
VTCVSWSLSFFYFPAALPSWYNSSFLVFFDLSRDLDRLCDLRFMLFPDPDPMENFLSGFASRVMLIFCVLGVFRIQTYEKVSETF